MSELGPVVAERSFALRRADGSEQRIVVRLGTPRCEERQTWLGPVQILGIGDDRVRVAWGEDPFVALQYAITLIGLLLEQAVEREHLEIPFTGTEIQKPGTDWIWRFPVE